jgi:hypothetical protein
MSLINDFRREMAQSITVQNVTAGGMYGPTYGSATTYRCHIKHEMKNIITNTGDAVVSSSQIYLDGHPSGISESSKINYGSKLIKILRVVRRFDDVGRAYATIVYT